MTDNIKPEHYRTGEIDLYEAWYRTYPFNEYRAIMQAVAERYMRRDKNDRVEDIGKAIYTLERLKEKEIEHAGGDEESITKDETIFETVIAYSDGVPVFKTERPGESIAGQYLDEIYYQKSDLLKRLWKEGYRYLVRDENGGFYAFDSTPSKDEEAGYWDVRMNLDSENILDDDFPEVKWTDEMPTKIAELLEAYENGGENGK